MATLEKIRSKSVLLFTVIIVALLAFILGDFFTSGRSLFGNGTTIAEVDGNKIDVQVFQNRLNAVNQQYQNQNRNIEDQDELQSNVLDQMLFEALMANEIEKLGISVADDELSQVMQANPQWAQMLDAISNPAKYQLTEEMAQQLKAQWIEMENQTDMQLKQQKFGDMFNGLYVANELDAKSIYDENNTTSHIAFVSQELSSLPDDKYEVTDAEIQEEWAKNKQSYRLDDETRTVDYITVNIVPSPEDNVAAEKEVEDAIAALKGCPNTEAIASNFNFNVDRKTSIKAKIANAQVKNFVDSAKAGDVILLPKFGNTYTIAKLIGTNSEVDSINISMVQAADSTLRDSIMSQIANNVKISDIKNSDKVMVQDSVWNSFVGAALPKNLKNLLLTSEIGKAVAFDSIVNGQPLHAIYKVNTRKAPVTTYDVAVITYEVEPSTTTINKLNNDLRQFITENNNAAALTEKAAEAGYILMPTSVTKNSAHIYNLPESRSAVKWVMDAEKGQVSDIYSNKDNSRLLVVSLKDIYTDYIPATDPDIKKSLTDKIRKDKKAAEIINNIKGKATDLDGYAKLMSTNVDSTNVTFGQPMIVNFGIYESALIGQVAAAQQGKITGPVQTNNAVAVFSVYNVDNQGRPFNFEESAKTFDRTYGNNVLNNNIFKILCGREKIENNILKFFER